MDKITRGEFSLKLFDKIKEKLNEHATYINGYTDIFYEVAKEYGVEKPEELIKEIYDDNKVLCNKYTSEKSKGDCIVRCAIYRLDMNVIENLVLIPVLIGAHLHIYNQNRDLVPLYIRRYHHPTNPDCSDLILMIKEPDDADLDDLEPCVSVDLEDVNNLITTFHVSNGYLPHIAFYNKTYADFIMTVPMNYSIYFMEFTNNKDIDLKEFNVINIAVSKDMEYECDGDCGNCDYCEEDDEEE